MGNRRGNGNGAKSILPRKGEVAGVCLTEGEAAEQGFPFPPPPTPSAPPPPGGGGFPKRRSWRRASIVPPKALLMLTHRTRIHNATVSQAIDPPARLRAAKE